MDDDVGPEQTATEIWGLVPGYPSPPPTELIATLPRPIVWMMVFPDRLFVATSDAVWERREDGKLHQLTFVERFEDVGFGPYQPGFVSE